MAKEQDISNSGAVTSTDVVKLLKAFTEMARIVPDKVAKGAAENVKDIVKVVKTMVKGLNDIVNLVDSKAILRISNTIGQVNGDKSTGLAGIFTQITKLTKPFTEFITNFMNIFQQMSAQSMLKLYVSIQVGLGIMNRIPKLIGSKMSNFKQAFIEIIEKVTEIVGSLNDKFNLSKIDKDKQNPIVLAVEGVNSIFKLFTDVINTLSTDFLSRVKKIIILYPLYKFSIKRIQTLIGIILDTFKIDPKSEKQFKDNANNIKAIFDTFSLFSNHLIKTFITAWLITKYKSRYEELVATIGIILTFLADTLKEVSEKLKKLNVTELIVKYEEIFKFIRQTIVKLFFFTKVDKNVQSAGDFIERMFTTIENIFYKISAMKRWNLLDITRTVITVETVLKELKWMVSSIGTLCSIGLIAFIPIRLGMFAIKLTFKALFSILDFLSNRRISIESLTAVKNLTFVCLAIGAIAAAVAAITITGMLVAANLPSLLIGLGALIVGVGSIYLFLKLINLMDNLLGKNVITAILKLALVVGTLTLVAIGVVILSKIVSTLTPEDGVRIIAFLVGLAIITLLVAGIGILASAIVPALLGFAAIPLVILTLIVTATLLMALNPILILLDEMEYVSNISKFIWFLAGIMGQIAVAGTLMILTLPGVAAMALALTFSIGSLFTTALAVIGLSKMLDKIDWDATNDKIDNLLNTGKKIAQGLNSLFGNWTVLGDLRASISTAANSAALIASIAPLFTMAKLIEKLGNLDDSIFDKGYKRAEQLVKCFFGEAAFKSLYGGTVTEHKPGIATMIMCVLSEFGKSMSFENSLFGSLNPFATSDQELVSEALESAFGPLNKMVDLMEKTAKMDVTNFDKSLSMVKRMCIYFFGTGSGDYGIAGMVMQSLSAVTLTREGSGWNPFAKTDQEKTAEMLNTAMNPLSTMIDIIEKLANGKVQEVGEDGKLGKWIKLDWIAAGTKAKENLSKIIPDFISLCNMLTGGEGNDGGFFGFGKSDFEKTVEMINESAKPINSIIDIFTKINKMEWKSIKEPLDKFRGMAWRYKSMFQDLNNITKTTDKKDVAHKEIVKSVDGIVDSVNSINDSKADKFVKVMDSLTKFSSSWNGSIDKLVNALAGKEGLIVKLTNMNEQLQKVADNKVTIETTSAKNAQVESKQPEQKIEKTDLTQVLQQIEAVASALEAIKSSGLAVHQESGDYFIVKNY